MTRSFRRRGLAASALAVASATTLAGVGLAAPAGAATDAAPGFYSAATQGDVVQIALNLPTDVPGLGTNAVALGLISAHGTALHDALKGTVKNTSEGFAGLASGTLVEGDNAPLGMLHRTIKVDLAKRTAKDALGELPANPLGSGGAGELSGAVTGVVDNATSAQLANASLAKLADILPADILSPLNDGYSQVATQTQDAINQVIDGLQPVLQPVAQNDPTGTAAQVEQALRNLNAQIPGLLAQIENGALVKLDLLDAKQTIAQVRDGESSAAHVKLVGLDILGGLVHVDGFASDATAFANGKDGGADATYNPVIADATIGKSVLGVTLDAKGLGLTVGGLPSSVVQQVDAGLAQVSDAINSLLSQIGVSIEPAAGHKEVSADGKYAKATGGALTITLSPPISGVGTSTNAAAAAKPLLQVKLGGTTAEARAEMTPVVMARPAALPHTGANLPLIAGGGLGLMLAAGLVRRRFIG